MKKIGLTGMILLAGIMISMFLPVQANAKETITIMIDPGHGGENLGADYKRDDGKAFLEKDMTLITALSMKEELEKYEGITVLLTRETDVEQDISLKDRILAAKEHNADYFICLHYNMSVSHILYGSEVWVPSTGTLYSKSASLATEFMKEFEQKDLFLRGIKTRLNDKGTDYYGILRNATEQNIPTVLVEHCHLDNERDFAYYETEEALEEFGRQDATAVAKYFGLKAPEYGYDYSTYQQTEIPVPKEVVAPDTTAPDSCEITLKNYDTTAGMITMDLNAVDAESDIQYYTYSYDGGLTFAPLLEWEGTDQVSISFEVEDQTTPHIIAKVYNRFDLFTDSEQLSLSTFEKKEVTIIPSETPEMLEVIKMKEQEQEVNQKSRIVILLTLCFVVIAAVSSLILILKVCVFKKSKKSNRRRKSPKE